MLVEKEVIRPGTYWYRDEATNAPRKLVVTPELTHYWHKQGNAMLGAGLTIPIPCEHDFNSHPMTPADKLKNNAGWVKEYRLRGDRLFSALDIQDEAVAKKLPGTIRWTSPWINTFTDGNGKEWKNVISHLALTTRPRIIEQAPFTSVAAALSIATEVRVKDIAAGKGMCLTNACRLATRKSDKKLFPRYPIAFSMVSGVALAQGDMLEDDDDDELEDDSGGDDSDQIPTDDDPSNDATIDLAPLNDPAGDVSMVELLCDLLGALGIQVEHGGDESQFKRELYNAAMTEIHNLTGKAKQQQEPANRTNPPGMPPNNPKQKPGAQAQPNPLIQQEQQPMYMSHSGEAAPSQEYQPMFMSLEDINKLDEPLRSVALSMYNETQKATAKVAEAEKVLNSLRDKALKEASDVRAKRINLIVQFMPRVKPDLDAMLALPSMAMSMGDGGAVIDPMAGTLAVLEKGLTDLPRLLTADSASFTAQPQPSDETMLSEDRSDAIADTFARQMGCPPLEKARA